MTRKFRFAFFELHSGSFMRYTTNLFENTFLKCYKVKTILIFFNCFSEYRIIHYFFMTLLFSSHEIHYN